MKDQSNARGKSLLVKPNTSSFYYVFQYRRRRTGGKHTAVFLLHVSGWHASTNVFINNKKIIAQTCYRPPSSFGPGLECQLLFMSHYFSTGQ